MRLVFAFLYPIAVSLQILNFHSLRFRCSFFLNKMQEIQVLEKSNEKKSYMAIKLITIQGNNANATFCAYKLSEGHIGILKNLRNSGIYR